MSGHTTFFKIFIYMILVNKVIRGIKMIKTISVKNDIVLDTLNNSTNASLVVENAILYYLDLISKEYIEKFKAAEELRRELKSL